MKLRFPSLVIPIGGTDSENELSFQQLRHIKTLSIAGPSALTGTVKVQVAFERSGTATWSDLQSGGSDVTVSAGNTTVITDIPAARLRLVSSAAEAAEREFSVFASER